MIHTLKTLKNIPEGVIFVVMGKKGHFIKKEGVIYKVSKTTYHNNEIRITTVPFQGKLKGRHKNCIELDLSMLMPAPAHIVIHPGRGKAFFYAKRVGVIPYLNGRDVGSNTHAVVLVP